MRVLKKDGEPQWLIDNAARLTSDYVSAENRGGLRPWAHESVVLALRRESRDKCMYCEARPGAVSFPNVEHIKPKSLFPDLVVAWSNLGLACEKCNNSKRDYWHKREALRILNPYEDRVEDRVRWLGTLAVPELNDVAAGITIKKLRIGRTAEQFQARSRAIDHLEAALEQWAAEDDPEICEVFADEVRRLLGDDEEYCSMLRSHAAARGFDG